LTPALGCLFERSNDPGLDKEQTEIALIFRDPLTNGDVLKRIGGSYTRRIRWDCSVKKCQTKIKAELPAFAHFLLNTEFPEPGFF
jgi:hypothetical protein